MLISFGLMFDVKDNDKGFIYIKRNMLVLGAKR